MLKRILFFVLLAGAFTAYIPVQAIKDSAFFDRVKAHMYKNYMQGLHKWVYWTDYDYCSHDLFLKDMECGELIQKFKLALCSANAIEKAEARETFESILEDFERCLSREENHQSYAEAQLYAQKDQDGSGRPGHLWHQALREVTKTHSNCEILKKRIEVWSQLLPERAAAIKVQREKGEVVIGLCLIAGALVWGMYRYIHG